MTTPAEGLRIIVADDHTFYREGVKAMLGLLPGAEVVGEASTGEEAVRLAAASSSGAQRCQPCQRALLSVAMPKSR